MRFRAYSLPVAVIILIASSSAVSQPAQPAPLPTKPLQDGWEQIDQRLVFLMVELSNVEASLNAVNKAMKVSGYQQSVKKDEASTFRGGNDLMDRRMGGPVDWWTFYGHTAERFFYHPVDRNTTYRTETRLRQTAPQRDLSAGEGVPSRQGVPVHQRPPQFDYIYRSNANAQARAEQEASALSSKAGKLLERRRQLENEQSALWCKVASQALASRKLAIKPIYRFLPTSANNDAVAVQRQEAMRAAAEFVRLSDALAEEGAKRVDTNQSQVFAFLQQAIAPARADLDTRLLKQVQLSVELADGNSPLGKFSAFAQRLDDLTKNIADAHRMALEGDQAGDDSRRNTFRGLLQEALLNYAEVVSGMDECVSALAVEWAVTADVNSPAAEVKSPVAFSTAAEGVFKANAKETNGIMPSLAKTDPGAKSTSSAAPIGVWIERRPGTPVGDRIRNFMADGTLVMTMPKMNQRVMATWRRDGSRVYFTEPGQPVKWFEIAESSNEQLKIRMEGNREYIWPKAESTGP